MAGALSQLKEFDKMTKDLFKAELVRVKQHAENVSMDSDTAHLQLTVSVFLGERKSVSVSFFSSKEN